MGYWANTTYINHGDVKAVADALTNLCEAEGMTRVPSPPPRQRLTVEPMQYDDALNNDLWGVAVFPGAPSWTVIQTAPLELLSERAPGAARMRLADLCQRLAAASFQLNIYDSSSTILLEVSAAGEIFTSGFNVYSSAGDPFQWHSERLSEELYEAQFQLHPFQELIADVRLGDDRARVLAERFGGPNAAFCDNLVSVDTLIGHKPFTAPGGVALYFKWPGQSRQRYPSCATWDEYQAAMRR